MHTVTWPDRLERVEYHPTPDGMAVAYLRENVTFVEGTEEEPAGHWEADEVIVETDLDEQGVWYAFDRLWVAAETQGKSLAERVAELEDLTDALTAIILDEGV